jgi:conjugative transfer signal peptidase TraF
VTAGYLVTAVLVAGTLTPTIVATPPVLLMWNTTASMPPGLYRLVRAEPTRGQLVMARLPPSIEARAVALGILAARMPVLKRIAAAAGDLVCRFGALVTINGHPVAIARRHDRHTRKLPVWQGCRRLVANEVFLLGRHPDSFDGRYFGPIDLRLCVGVAYPIFLRASFYWYPRSSA